jgi:hypothetical protein
MEKTSGDFVKSLKDKISKQKKQEKFQRNILHDSLDYLISIIKGSSQIELRSVKNFKTSEISCFLNLYCESDDIPSSIESLFNDNSLDFRKVQLDEKKFLYLVDFGENIVSSGSEHNWFFLEFYFKGKYIFESKLTTNSDDLFYSVFDRKYYSIKFWVCDNLELFVYEFPIRNFDRNKNKTKVELDEKYTLTILFDQVGEVEKINISRRIGRKKEK